MNMKVFDLKTGTVVFSKNVGEEVICLAWDGVMGIMGGGHGDVSVWDLARGSGEPVFRVKRAHQGRVTSLHTRGSGDGEGVVVVTGGEDRRVIVWRQEIVK